MNLKSDQDTGRRAGIWLALAAVLAFAAFQSQIGTQTARGLNKELDRQAEVALTVDHDVGQLHRSFKAFEKDVDLRNDIEAVEISGGLEFRIINRNLFVRGAPEIRKEPARSLSVLANWVRSQDQKYIVIVEGHTDQSPITSAEQLREFPSNWELSGARAAAVVRLFEDNGYPASQLIAVGFGDSRPLVTERDPAGNIIYEKQALNRRIVIKMMHKKMTADFFGKSQSNSEL